MNYKCKICGESIKNDRHYYQAHKITAAEYYVKYHPRKDLLTGEPILFKNKFKYFETFFAKPANMKKWVLQSDKKAVLTYVETLIKLRQKRALLTRPLGEADLMTLDGFPDLTLLLKKITLKEYKSVYKKLGIEGSSFSDYSLKPIPQKKLEIGIDTRENNPFKLDNSKPFKMDYGDYTALGEDFDNLFVDRKSGPDFIQTFGGQIERFDKEVQRAKDFNAYLVVLVEVAVPLLKTGKGKLFYYTKCSPESIFHNTREITQKFDNIQFLFTKSRIDATRCLPKILSYGKAVKEVDLQYLYNGGKL